MNATKAQLKIQYNRAVSLGWIPIFTESCAKHRIAVALVLAIASRETNMKNIRGDFRGGKYHGYGPMQVDIGTDAAFARNWKADDAAAGIKRGIEILAEKRAQLIKVAGKSFTVTDSRSKKRHTATAPSFKGDAFVKVMIGMFNGGLWAVYHAAKGRDSDDGTTGEDYGDDVLARMDVFEAFLRADKFEAGVPGSTTAEPADAINQPQAVDVESTTPASTGTSETTDAPSASEGECAPEVPAQQCEAIEGGRPSDPIIKIPTNIGEAQALVGKVQSFIPEGGNDTTKKWITRTIGGISIVGIFNWLRDPSHLIPIGICMGVAILLLLFWLYTRYSTKKHDRELVATSLERDKQRARTRT